jgi:hypothetical protein
MIARAITIVAPIVNEWPAPWPICIILFFTFLGIIVCSTFPNEQEFI